MPWRDVVAHYHEPKTGPRPAFRRVDLLRAFYALSEQPASRGALAKQLDLGEGSVRSILQYFAAEEFATSLKRGVVLTKKGDALRNDLLQTVASQTRLGALSVTAGQPSCALLLLEQAEKFKRGTEQRDAAVREGAIGATSLYLAASKRWHFVGDSEHARGLDAQTESQLNASFPNAKPGDALILCFGGDEAARERGVWAAALTLFESKR